jgi:hypothetical protein
MIKHVDHCIGQHNMTHVRSSHLSAFIAFLLSRSIGRDIIHSLNFSNLSSRLLIKSGLSIRIMMRVLDIDSDLIAKQRRNLLQRLTRSLRVDKVDDGDEDGVAYNKDDKVSPRDVLDGDGRDLHQHDGDGVEGTEGDCVSGGADGRRHDLRGVGVAERIHDEGVSDEVDEHEADSEATEKHIRVVRELESCPDYDIELVTETLHDGLYC